MSGGKYPGTISNLKVLLGNRGMSTEITEVQRRGCNEVRNRRPQTIIEEDIVPCGITTEEGIKGDGIVEQGEQGVLEGVLRGGDLLREG